MLSQQEFTEIRSLVPEDVYVRFGAMSGAAQSYLIVLLLKEIRELRDEVEKIGLVVGS